MLKVLKGFILANGEKFEPGQVVGEDQFLEEEAVSLMADGSLEEIEEEQEELGPKPVVQPPSDESFMPEGSVNPIHNVHEEGADF